MNETDKQKSQPVSDLSKLLTPEQLKRLQAMDVEEDVEIAGHRKVRGFFAWAIMAWAVATAVVHIYLLVYRPVDPLLLRGMHVMTLSVLGFILVPGWARAKEKVHILDLVGALLCIGTFLYIFINFQEYIWRIRVRPTTLDVIFGVILIILILEMTRRCSGYALLILSAVFMGYGLFGQYLPGMVGHRGYTLPLFIGNIVSDYGIYSTPINICSRYIILFIIFAAFLQVSGVGRYFVEWAFSVSGGARGGPAKVAVIASALMGTMNGTSAGNAVATGSLTIPLMKKVGYSPMFAAATEAVASTGGQIMPPIMGAGIFIMAEITGIHYTRIMLAGAIPAILYFSSCYFMVDYEAVKLGLLGFPRAALPRFFQVMKKGYLFIPVIVLFYFLLSGRSVIWAGWMGIVSCFAVSWLNALINRDWRKGMDFGKLAKALENGARGTIQLMAVCAAAGIIMGIIGLTGIGVKFGNLLLNIAGTSQLLALIFTMAVAILLGMGMPTTAAYAVAATVLTPGLIRMGIPPLVAHMFVFYFACVSAITPPVALASYAASGISGSDPIKTGYMSFRLGLTAYVVPFMFFYAPGLILGNLEEVMTLQTVAADGSLTVAALSWTVVVIRTLTALLGVYALASAVQRWYFGRIRLIPQLLLFGAAICLMTASTFTDAIGLAIMVGLLLFQKLKAKESGQTAAA